MPKKKSTSKNRRLKYDFISIKNEFLVSDYDEVKIFFTDKYQIYNSYIAENTNGWAAEKKEWRRKIALAANKQTFENEVRVKADALRRVLQSFLKDFEDKVYPCDDCGGRGKDLDKKDAVCKGCNGSGNRITRFEDLPIKIRRMLWEIWRVENNLPTNLSKFQQLPGPAGETPISEHTRKILKENGIEADDVMV